MFVAVQAVLSLYANAKTTGIVLDSGDGVSHALPVFDGFSISQAATRSDIAGRDVTEALVTLLRRAGYNFTTTAEFEIVKKIKEKTCSVSNVPISDDKGNLEDKKIKSQYVLPDGTSLELGSERIRAPEILFNPERAALECLCKHEISTAR
jgi:centractin